MAFEGGELDIGELRAVAHLAEVAARGNRIVNEHLGLGMEFLDGSDQEEGEGAAIDPDALGRGGIEQLDLCIGIKGIGELAEPAVDNRCYGGERLACACVGKRLERGAPRPLEHRVVGKHNLNGRP